MKSIASYITLFAFSASLFINVIIVAEYIFNFQYYSTELCTFKNKPETGCLGTCQLQNKLEDERNKNENPLEQLQQFSFEGVEYLDDATATIQVEQVFNFRQSQNGLPAEIVDRHFHPPQILSV